MKQIICDKCGKALVVSMTKNETYDGSKDDVFGKLQEMLDGMGNTMDIPEFKKEIEGCNLIVNLPKHKVKNKVYDLCEKCTKDFLKNNINKWMEKKNEKSKSTTARAR